MLDITRRNKYLNFNRCLIEGLGEEIFYPHNIMVREEVINLYVIINFILETSNSLES